MIRNSFKVKYFQRGCHNAGCVKPCFITACFKLARFMFVCFLSLYLVFIFVLHFKKLYKIHVSSSIQILRYQKFLNLIQLCFQSKNPIKASSIIPVSPVCLLTRLSVSNSLIRLPDLHTCEVLSLLSISQLNIVLPEFSQLYLS